MENAMMFLSRRMVLGLTVPALLLILAPNSWGQGCCCGGMSQAMLQRLQFQLMQQQYSLRQQTSPTMNFQKAINQLATQSESSVREAMKDDEVLTRLSAAYVTGEKRLPLQADLIKLLTDKNDAVRQVARLSLIKLSLTATPPQTVTKGIQTTKKATQTTKKATQTACRGMDFGPLPNANRADQVKAARQWQEWWDKSR
jgi:hypothetical protein